jgi:hypothetical protein
MSKTRKSGNRYGGSPSTRDKLSSAFIEALAEDWAENGSEVIAQIRRDSPVKYGELIARLVSLDPNPSHEFDFANATSMHDIGYKFLRSVGFEEPDEESIQRAIEANDRFVGQLEAIRDAAEGKIQ